MRPGSPHKRMYPSFIAQERACSRLKRIKRSDFDVRVVGTRALGTQRVVRAREETASLVMCEPH